MAAKTESQYLADWLKFEEDNGGGPLG